MNTRNKVLVIAAVFFLLHDLMAQGTYHAAGHSAKVYPSIVSVHSSVDAWIKGYTKWSTSHPELLFGPGTPSAQAAQASGKPDESSLQINLRWPFLSYFGPDGNLIYAGMESNANIAFLQSLSKSGQAQPAKPLYPPQPPLEAYFDIFPALQRYKPALLSSKHPVLLTICKDTAPACKQQGDALEAIKARLPAMKTQLIEVRIDPTNKQ